MANEKDFTIKMENILPYEIEMDDDFARSEKTAEQMAEIKEANDKWNEHILINNLKAYAAPCECLTNKIIEKTQNRARLLNVPPNQMGLVIDQEDIDQKYFAPIIIVNKSKRDHIRFTVCQCKRCNKITMFGDIIPVATSMTNALIDHLNMLASMNIADEQSEPEPVTDITGDNYLLENVDTGEITPATDLTSINTEELDK